MSSSHIEDYLKHIYKIQERDKKVTTTSLAAQLDIAPASVTDMVKKLSEQGLLHHTPYQGIELTEKGKKLALKIVRRHRLWEVLLVQLLHYSWDKIDEEAEKLEHITSDELEQKIDEVLGFPKLDPHGDPIPSVDGELKEREYAPLADFEEGETGIVIRVSDSNPQILQYAAKMGLALKKKVYVKEKIAYDGSLLVRIGSKERFISQKLACHIFVERR